jgi:hypothetical protein
MQRGESNHAVAPEVNVIHTNENVSDPCGQGVASAAGWSCRGDEAWSCKVESDMAGGGGGMSQLQCMTLHTLMSVGVRKS